MKLKKIISKQKNKKGNVMVMIIFIIALFAVLFIGFIMIVGSAILNFVFDTAVPELTNLGMVGDANMTQIAGSTITPLNNLVQSFTWLAGVLYILMLVASMGFVFVMRTTPQKWLIGLYFALALLLIIGSIFISNMYEEFATGDDDLSSRLQEHTILNWMLLYSPAILTVIVFMTGVILFSGLGQDSEI
jgi:hypothetical protein